MKPILFNTAMVRALPDGRKTVTRRAIKPQPTKVIHTDNDIGAVLIYNGTGRVRESYHIGDILYVRETFAEMESGYLYKADFSDDGPDYGMRWCPSIHMPKAAARIFLRVTDVRVNRLQDMTENDAIRDFDLCADAIRAVGMETLCKSVWDSTIRKADLDKYGWSANPWVWTIEFARIGKEETNREP